MIQSSTNNNFVTAYKVLRAQIGRVPRMEGQINKKYLLYDWANIPDCNVVNDYNMFQTKIMEKL